MPDDPRLPTPPTPPRSRKLSARAALACIGLAVLLLVLCEGRSVRHAGEEMQPGWERSLVLAVGRPAGWIADQLPLADVASHLTAWLRPSGDTGGNGPGSFSTTANAGGAGAARGAVPPVTPDAFDPVSIGARPVPPRPLHTVLVTGISVSGVADWGALSVQQVRQDHPDAVVMFLGANEGFPFQVGGRAVPCCGRDWAAEYAYRARRMMNTFRQAGTARVYWLLLPAPRAADRQIVAKVVNAAIGVAAEPYRAQVRLLDMYALFTPGGRYRDAMPVNGQDTIVRQADGIHLNEAGADVAAGAVLAAMRGDWPSVPR